MRKLAVILCAVVMLCSCDTKKEERKSLQFMVNDKLNSVAQVEQEIRNTEARQVNIKADMVALNNALTKDESSEEFAKFIT